MTGSTNLNVLFDKVSLTRRSNQGVCLSTNETMYGDKKDLVTTLKDVSEAFKNGGSAVENYHKGLAQLQEKGYTATPSNVVNYIYKHKNVGYKRYTNLPDGTKIIEKKLGDIEGAISKNPKTNKWSLISFKMPELILDNGKIEHISGSVIDAIEQKVPKRFRKQLNEVVENFAKSLLKMK